MNRNLNKLFNTTKILLELSADVLGDAISPLNGTKGIYIAARKLNMHEYQVRTALQSLRRGGYVKKSEEGLLITPKGKRRIKHITNQKVQKKWDGKWRVVIYDIPENLRGARDALRYYLRENNFVRLQNSVFVSPRADFNELDMVRREYKVEKYVNFLEAKSVSYDDDSLLKKRFNLF